MKARPNWRWKPLVLAVALAVAPAYAAAQVAAAAGGPGVGAALNGVPVVNIVAPNGAGVSHNLYNQFNVDSRGLILNNATTGVVSQLGGAILQNPNLGNTAARLILNEVVQPNPSMLAGFIEVAGMPASVVLANAAGITCNGCGFVNTPRVTLTTGAPTFDATGNLAGFNIQSGAIAITGAGLDGSRQSYFDILARSISLTGQVNAHDLVLAGGASHFDYAGRTATASAGSGAVPLFALDSSALGGMYADRIRLIATENGVGVRVLGDVGASVDDVTLTSAGQIQLLGRVTAQRDLSIGYTGAAAANAVTLGAGATVVAGQDLTVNGGAGGASFSGGTLGANRNTTLQLASLTDTGTTSDLRYAGGQLLATIDGAASIDGPNWNGTGGLNLSAASLTTGAGGAGFFAASGAVPSGTVTLHTTGDLALGSSEVSGTTVSLTTDNGTLSIGSGGAVKSSGAVNLGVGNGFTNAGAVAAGGDLNFSTAKSTGTLVLANQAGAQPQDGLLQAGGAINATFAAPLVVSLNNGAGARLIGDTLAISVNAVDNAGKLQGTHGSTITTASFTNEAGGLAELSGTAGSNGVLNTNTLVNSGSGISNGAATAGITSNGGMTLNVRDTLTNNGNLVAAQALTVAGSGAGALAVNNAGANSLLQAGGTLTLQGNGGNTNLTLTNAAGATVLGDQLAIKASGVTNDGNLQGNAGANITVAGNFVNQGAGIVTLGQNGGNGSISATLIKNTGTGTNNGAGSIIQSGGVLNLTAGTTAGGAQAIANQGKIAASGGMNLQSTASGASASSLVNSGKILAGGALNFTSTAGAASNSTSGSLIQGGSINFTNAGSLTNNGAILASGPLSLSAQSITNSGTAAIAANNGGAGTLNLTATGGNINNSAGGLIISSGAMSLSASGGITNDLNYGADGMTPTIGTIQSGGALTIGAGGTLTNRGYIDSNSGNVNVTAAEIDVASVAPDTVSTGGVVLIPGTKVDAGYNNWFNGLVVNKVSFAHSPGDTLSTFQLFYDDTHQGFNFIPCCDPNTFYFLFTNGSIPLQGSYMYHDFNAKAQTGLQYKTTAVQAHLAANGGNMTLNGPVKIIGGEVSASGALTINGSVDLTPVAIGGQSVYNVQGTDRWFCDFCTPQTWNSNNLDDLAAAAGYDARDLRSYGVNHDGKFDAAYEAANLNLLSTGAYTMNLVGSGSLISMSASLQSSGGKRLDTAGNGAANPGGMTINGSVTTHLPADLIPGLAQLGVAQHQLKDQPTLQPNNLGGTASGTVPPAVLAAAGVNLSLPTNPNGLFIVNPNPSGKYLIETNPLYTSLENILFGSDYLVDKLGYNPNGVQQRLGDAAYEAQLISQQISAQTGRTLLAGNTDINGELQSLYNSASWEAQSLHLTLGVALSADQLNSLKQDMVWMVSTVVGGHTVLVPVVYLTDATRQNIGSGTQIVANDLSVNGGSFINNGGAVTVTNALSIHTTGNIVNTAGNISGGNVSLTSDTGNITNAAVVTRLGDSDNYHDVIDRGSIVSTGTLNINAVKGNVNNVGSQIAAGGDASLNAGGNINFQNVILESKSTTTTSSSSLFGINHSSTTTIVTNQNAVGGDMAVGGNLTLNAGQNVNLTGSQVKAQGDVTATAQKINVQNATTTNTYHSETKSSGLGMSVSGDSSNGTVSMGYGTSSSTTDRTDVNVVASGLSSGGNMTLNGRSSVTVTGSDVSSGGDLRVNTAKLVTDAAQQTSTVNTSSSSSSYGLQASGNHNDGSLSAAGSHTDNSGSSFDSTARVSTLSSGGNMVLGTGAGDGSISHTGTQISAGGNFAQAGSSVTFNAAQDQHQSSYSTSTSGGSLGVGMKVGAQDAYDQAKSGGVPSAAAPSVQIQAGGSHSEGSGSSSSTQAVVGGIRAGGSISSTSTGNTTLEGTNIAAGGNVALKAGSLDYKAATSTSQSSSSSMTASGQAYVGEDMTGSATGGASGSYGNTSAGSNSSTQQAGNIRAGGNLNITTTSGDANFTGTNINTGGSATIASAGKVNYQAATDTSSSSSSSMNAGGGFDASKSGKGSDASKSGGVNGSYSNSSDSQSSTTQRGGSIAAGAGVTISAGQGSDLTMVGTNIAAGGDVGLSGRNVNLQAAQSTSTSSSSSLSAGGSFSKEVPTKSGGGSKTAAKGGKEEGGDNGGQSQSGQFAMSNNSGSSTTQRGGVITGQNVRITASNDLSMQGTVVGARDSAGVSAGGKLSMQSAQDTSTSSGMNASAELGYSSGDSRGGNIGGSGGTSSGTGVTNHNAIISGNNVSVSTGGDATLAGANIAGNRVTTSIGGNLGIESRADVNNSSNRQAGAYVGITYAAGSGREDSGSTSALKDAGSNSTVSQRGELLKSGIGTNSSNSSSNSTAVNLQSGITGTQSNQVTVTGNTNLTGATIGGAPGSNVSLTTSQLTQGGVAQSSSSSNASFGFSAKLGDLKAPGGSLPSSSSDSSTLQSSVQGAVTQTNPNAAPVASNAPAAGAPIQPNLNLAQLGTVLNQPQVQTAMLLNRGMRTAVAQYGSSDNVPAPVMRQILADAGVPVTPNASNSSLAQTFQSAVNAGKTSATQQMGGGSVPQTQVDSLLQAMSLK